jgi:hypothetical protein
VQESNLQPSVLSSFADARYIAADRGTGLEEAEKFEHDHDNDNHSDDVEDASVHVVLISEWMRGGHHLCKLRVVKDSTRFCIAIFFVFIFLSPTYTWRDDFVAISSH